MAADMIFAIRTALQVFSLPDKDRWTMGRLLHQLRGAEDLAREMLREIAMKISISPAKFRERTKQGVFTPAENIPRSAPYFRLGIKAAKPDSPEGENELSRASGEHKQATSADAPSQTQSGEEAASSTLEKRRQALEDVLAHPGKHAARMARALYRAEHGPGERLIAKDEDDILLDTVIHGIDAFERGDNRTLRKVHSKIVPADTS